MTSRKKIGIAAAAVALVGLAGVALAKGNDYYHKRHGFDGGGHFGFGGVSRLADALDLNDEQREKTRAIMNSVREFHRGHRDGARDEIAAVFTKESLSPAEAKDLLNLRERRREEGRAFMGAKLSEFHGILTPAQRERAVALMAERRGGFFRGFGRDKHRRHHGHGRGHGHWDWDDDDNDHHRGRD